MDGFLLNGGVAETAMSDGEAASAQAGVGSFAPTQFAPALFASGLLADPLPQLTLRAAIGCAGTGLHSGQRVAMTLHPAPAGHGIVFRRTDLGVDIPARHDRAVETQLCTMIADPARPDAKVGTIEHLMAAFAAAGIDNVLVELDGPEVPIFDGSAEPFSFLLDCAGSKELALARPVMVVLRPVRVEAGGGFAELRPLAAGGVARLEMAMSIDFAAPAIGRQAMSLTLSPESFRHDLATARTFAMANEVAQLRDAGLARGGSLENAVVVDHARVLNPEGLRQPDEFVRHKLMDAVGDLALAGAMLHARFVAHRSGHRLNNRLLHALFAATDAWCLAPTPLSAAGLAAAA